MLIILTFGVTHTSYFSTKRPFKTFKKKTHRGEIKTSLDPGLSDKANVMSIKKMGSSPAKKTQRTPTRWVPYDRCKWSELTPLIGMKVHPTGVFSAM